MHNVMAKTRPFQSEKIDGELYIDNEIAFGKETEVGLNLSETVTFNGIENVHRVSMLVAHDVGHYSISILAKRPDEQSASVIKQFDNAKDGEAFEWILDHIDP